MNQSGYPQVEINLTKLRHNIRAIKKRCGDLGIELAGVVKGMNGIPDASALFAEEGYSYIASSRLEQLQMVADRCPGMPLMMIRIPMLSEVEDIVRLADISLNSEAETLKALNEAAGRQGKTHDVILMIELGDLREGFWGEEEVLCAARLVENELSHLTLAGIGTNLGCYGSISATVEKMEELIALAELIEADIGRKLRYIGGGGTTSLPRVFEGNMPARINLLRVGEGILLAKDLRDLWGYDMSDYFQDAFTLKAEVIELKDKPSYPMGEIMFDAFGQRPTYDDRGVRRRALLALGKVDYAFCDMIYPRDKGAVVLGASSDHTIMDVHDVKRELKVGDIMEFDLCYPTMVFVTNSPNVKIVFTRQD